MTEADNYLKPVAECLRAPLDDFIVHLELQRGLSEHTVSGYAMDLAQFALFLRNTQTRRAWTDVTHTDVQLYLQYMTAELRYEQSTLTRKLAAIRSFAKFRVEQHEDPSLNFAELVQGPRYHWKTQTVPKFLSIEEITQLLDAPSTVTAEGIRDRAILEVLYSSGLRVSELCNLPLRSLHLDDGYLRVTGKGSKERIAPIGRPAITALQHYLHTARPQYAKSKKSSNEVFLSRIGKALTPRSIERLIKKAALHARVWTTTNQDEKLESHVTPHTLRHTFATHLLQGGADMRVIQESLGHESISTTEIYAKTNEEMLLEAHALHHPRAKDRST